MSHTQSAGRSSISNALAADRLGVPAVVFFVMSAATPLTVIAGVVTTGHAVTGLVGVPVAFVAIAVVLAVFSVGYVAMARRVANAGAFYAYVSQGLGRPLGVGASWIALLAYNALQVGLYGAVGVTGSKLIHNWVGLDLAWWVVAVAAWVLVAALGVQHVGVNGKVLAVLLVAEIIVIIVFSFTSVANPAGGAITFDTLSPANLVGPGVGAILGMAVLGFVGFESSAVFAEESRDRRRTVPIATYLSVALIGALYTFGSWALSVGVGPDKIVQASNDLKDDLLFSLAAQHLGEPVVAVGRLLFVTSIMAALISFHNTTARYAFALGRERVLPAPVGRTRSGAPWLGSLIQSAIGIIVIIIYAVAGWDPMVHLFYWCGTAGGLGVLVLIAATSIAVVVFFARDPHGETLWRRAVAPGLATLLVLAVVYLAFNNITTLLGVEPDSPLRWIVPGVYLAAALLGIGWALVLRTRRPEVYRAIGLGAAGEQVAP